MADDQEALKETFATIFTVQPGLWMSNDDFHVNIVNSGPYPLEVAMRQVKPPPQPDRCEVSFSGWDDGWFQCTLPDNGHEWHSADIPGGTLTFRMMKGC